MIWPYAMSCICMYKFLEPHSAQDQPLYSGKYNFSDAHAWGTF